jgi:tRNA U34 5-methylaminomethyl-2-thiouridine-forming methyltransferase MnmC
MFTPIRTADGTFTLYSDTYGEHYHSLWDGAFEESMYKHVIPACDTILQDNPDEITLLDICFGLGYNTLATLHYLKSKHYRGKITIYAPELDLELIHSLRLLPLPIAFIPYSSLLYELTKSLHFKNENIEITIINGDALAFVQTCELQFDIVYQDAFSHTKNPLLWSESYFKALYKCMKAHAIMTTYSKAGIVKRTLFAQGFSLFEHDYDKNFKVSSGTIASKAILTHFIPLKKFQHYP